MVPLCHKEEAASSTLWSFISGQVLCYGNMTIKLGSTNGAIFSPRHAATAYSKDTP